MHNKLSINSDVTEQHSNDKNKMSRLQMVQSLNGRVQCVGQEPQKLGEIREAYFKELGKKTFLCKNSWYCDL